MESREIQNIIEKQREYFKRGETLDVDFRIDSLKRLKNCIMRYEKDIIDALYEDLHKSETESYMTEIGLVLSELSYMIRHLRSFNKPKRVYTPLSQFHSKSYQIAHPCGCVLVMSPWNYPFMLTMEPMIDAIAAGNTVCVKPSAYSKATSLVMKKILRETFDERYVSIILGGRVENQTLLEQHFDYIFFTGSPNVGHDVMRKASVYLTPVTLELGGKSPCIVDGSANLKLAARRIVFGKFLNAGQTCVAPDYLYVQSSVKVELLKYIVKEIQTQYPNLELFGKIINEKHFNRLEHLIDPTKVIYGGKVYKESNQIEPTVMDSVDWSDSVMLEEIFGPILPVLTFETVDECIDQLQELPSPLALYIFSTQKDSIHKIHRFVNFGGGCINDTIIHLATSHMPFGGVGNSGMGQYHGKSGFDTFTHYKSIVDKKQWIDLPMRYQPFTKQKNKWIRMFLK